MNLTVPLNNNAQSFRSIDSLNGGCHIIGMQICLKLSH
jgi:hypothetical protein